jgi:ribonuclease E
MVVRQRKDRTQIAVLEDGVQVEHYVNRSSQQSYVGNVYLGKVQNVLPSMEAAFVDVGKGRNAVLYAGEVNFDVSGLEGASKRIESALKSGQSVIVQVTKDPVGHKGARLTSQVSLPGRYLVYVPGASMTGISRKLPDIERNRLKQILKRVMPEHAGVIVRTAAEGAAEEELDRDVTRLAAQWEAIEKKAKTATAPALLYSEPDPRSGSSGTCSTKTSASSSCPVTRPGTWSMSTSSTSRRTWLTGSPAGRAPAMRSPTTASTSSWPRRWSARSGCPAADRWLSTRPRR